jgi:S-formylglutathione hydrolase FrmB
MVPGRECVEPRRSTSRVSRALAIGTATVIAVLLLAGRALGAEPVFQSGDGITVLSQTQLTSRLYEIKLDTTDVQGEQQVRVLVPEGYEQQASVRYPVLYLLHGGGTPSEPAGAEDWTTQGEAEQTTAGQPLITVMPSAGNGGWYTNWLHPGAARPQRWQAFHIHELIPWIDSNLDTIAARKGRAIAGLSMGGYGAIRYAERFPGKFAFVASFSGALDMLAPQQQRTIYYTELINGLPGDGPFGHGSPETVTNEETWREADPVASLRYGVTRLRGMAIALYTGSGTSPDNPNAPIPTNFEAAVAKTNIRMNRALTAARIPHYFLDYGKGEGYGTGCDGNHDWGCWKVDLREALPRMMSVLAHP